ncbi:MAG TPA: GNAT family N-acetyltransferase [Steroidobacteraceae bacterium]
MRIRLATVGDVAQLAALVEHYWEFESIGGFDRPRIETLLGELLAEAQRGACWVAEADGRLCGYLLAVFMFSLEHGGLMAEIDEIFVSPQMRSAGVGASMVATAERGLAARGLVRLQLQLGVDNHGARRFYERHGFRRRGYELLDKPLQENPSR